MPKTGLKPSVWHERLKNYAAGTFNFDKDNRRPAKTSKWFPKLEAIDTCANQNKLVKDASGNISFGDPQCTCGYHAEKVIFK